ncbi:MAG: response regulator [Cyanobacteria bacterium P01_D01_bin.2]
MTTILIAEDEPRIAMFMSKGLKKEGYQTYVVDDGTQALALSLSGKFDLILLDVGLSGLDGWSVLSELRSSSSQPPVIIITALYGIEERDHSLSLGANGFISKPFRFNHLLKCIRRYV